MSQPHSTSGLRVFISYSHEDRAIFDAVCRALWEAGIRPSSDDELQHGTGFTEQIQRKISHAHVFIPILTPRSHIRGWVHQEIGYAVAMRIPCVPVCVGTLADGMIAPAHAVVVGEDLGSLAAKIQKVHFASLVEQAGTKWEPSGETCFEPEDRALVIERLSNEALEAQGPSCVRIQGGLSSFSIPDEPVDRPVWQARYGDKPRSAHACARFRRERQALAKHARSAGVRMIVNYGPDLDAQYGVGTKRTRLCLLLQFLESLDLPDDRVQVVLVPEARLHLILAVGDWFFAESHAARPVRGVLQTVFTVHAPTVNRRIDEFDQTFSQLLVDQSHSPHESRLRATARLKELIRESPAHAKWTCDAS